MAPGTLYSRSSYDVLPLCLFDNRLTASIRRRIETPTNVPRSDDTEPTSRFTERMLSPRRSSPLAVHHCHCLFLSRRASSGLCLFTCHRSGNYHSCPARPFVRTHSRRFDDRRQEMGDVRRLTASISRHERLRLFTPTIHGGEAMVFRV